MVYFEFWTYKSYQHSKIRISSGTKYGLRMFSIDFYINPLPFCTKDVGLGPSWAWRSSWSSTSRGVLRLQLFAELGSKKDWNLIESIGIYGNMIGIFNYRNIYIYRWNGCVLFSRHQILWRFSLFKCRDWIYFASVFLLVLLFLIAVSDLGRLAHCVLRRYSLFTLIDDVCLCHAQRFARNLNQGVNCRPWLDNIRQSYGH